MSVANFIESFELGAYLINQENEIPRRILLQGRPYKILEWCYVSIANCLNF